MATKDAVENGVNAGKIIGEIAKIAGGGGGGRPDTAQAGGKIKEKVDEAISNVVSVVKKAYKIRRISMDCLFCKIINGEIPSKKVYEDEFVYSFYDIEPQAPFHVLIIPETAHFVVIGN